MITNDDVTLSKLSYADSDFAELYPDLLDLTKQLTNKWDPSLSNESDPGVVLLKHAAFIGDHNNYNTDKNTLEAFLPTATQDRSVRNIVEMNGYTPRYYISASGNISFNYTGDAFDGLSTGISFTIPAFTIVVSNDDGSVAYTQIEDLVLTGKNIVSQALFMEGTLQTLQVNNGDKITLENIDNNYRIYFPDPYIAQNGVFVKNVGDSIYDVWKRNNYLLTQPKGTKSYKIDFDSNVGLPYIEFPTDIANLIGDGLNITYISTSGLSGNVSARALTTIQSPDKYPLQTLSVELDMADFEVKNNSSIVNGLDPETIDQMYQSFKKVVGTFDTLVTCLDYSNALYTAEDDLGNNYLGNAVVTDIRNDYNNAANLVTKDAYGVWYKNVSLGKTILSAYNFTYINQTTYESSGYTPSPGDVHSFSWGLGYFPYDANLNNGHNGWEDINNLTKLDFTNYINGLSPYDLVVKALKKYQAENYSILDPYDALEKSFEKPSNLVIEEAVEDISGYKCISHNYKYPNDTNNVYIFKEYAPIKCLITPYNKVSKYEQLEIKNNVYKVLSDKYNSRMVDWGEPINEEVLENDILSADERIRSVKLEPIEYIPKAAFLQESDSADGPFNETYLSSDLELQTDLVAKNVLAGRICLFEFDDNFTYEFGQIDATKYDDVKSITTNLIINAIEDASPQVSSQNYITSVNLSSIKTGIYYTSTNISSSRIITPGTGFDLTGNETITFYTLLADNSHYNLGTYKSDSDAGVTFNIYNNSSNQNIVLPANNSLLNIGDSANGIIVTRTEVISTSETESTEATPIYDYTLKENEYVIFKNKNYNSTKIYPATTSYRLDSNSSITINPNVFYTLGQNQVLTFIYTDSNDVAHKDIYQAGATIRTTFKLVNTDDSAGAKVNVIDPNNPTQKVICENIPSNGQIAICEPLTTIVDTNDMKCYWIMNNTNNVLFSDQGSTNLEVDLDEGEYFILATKSESQMVIFGSGTRITRTTGGTQWSIPDPTSINSIESTGFNANMNWQIKNFAQNPIAISEYSIIILGEDCTFRLYDDLGAGKTQLDNEWSEYNYKIEYEINGKTTVLEASNNPYYIKTRLDLSLINKQEQELKSTLAGSSSTSEETIAIKYGSLNTVATIDSTSPKFLQSNLNLDILGGVDIDLSAYGDNLSLYNYNIGEPYIIEDEESELSFDISSNQNELLQGENGLAIEDAATNGTVYVDDSIKFYAGDTEVTPSSAGEVSISGTTLEIGQTTFSSATTVTKIELTVNSGKSIEHHDDIYELPLDETISAVFPMYYKTEQSSLDQTIRNYIIPVIITTNSDGDGINPLTNNITVSVEDVTDSSNIIYEWKIGEYNSELGNSLTISTDGLHLITIARGDVISSTSELSDTSSVTIEANLNVLFNWTIPTGETGQPGKVNVQEPVVTTGINNNLISNASLSNVLDRITEILNHSSAPGTPIYYINKPENDLAIDNDDVLNLFDKNNVANPITIAQIDFEGNGSYIDIVKSMKKG